MMHLYVLQMLVQAVWDQQLQWYTKDTCAALYGTPPEDEQLLSSKSPVLLLLNRWDLAALAACEAAPFALVISEL